MNEMMFQHVSGPGSVLREEAFISVCDLLIFFSGNGEGKAITASQCFNHLKLNLIITQLMCAK